MTSFSPLNLLEQQAAESVRRELEKGEVVLWCSQPLPGRVARATIPLALFGMVFLGFAIFWIVAASGGMGPEGFGRPPIIFPLFGIPFVLVGLGMVLSPLWARRIAARTVYAITPRGALLIEGAFVGGRVVRWFGPEKLSNIERHERSDGSGDLILDRELVTHASNDGPGNHVRSRPRGFMGIADVREAERVLRSLTAEG
jgi:hypothetical protein